MSDKKRIPAISVESQDIIRRLEKCAVGDIVSYTELSQLAMGNVQRDKRFALQTARKCLLREKHWVFEAVINLGLKRLNDEEIVKGGEAAIAKTHRAARRELEKLACVDFDNLPRNKQIDHNTRMSVLGVLDHITKPRQIKQIESVVEKSQHRLQLQETLAAFDQREPDERAFPQLVKSK